MEMAVEWDILPQIVAEDLEPATGPAARAD